MTRLLRFAPRSLSFTAMVLTSILFMGIVEAPSILADQRISSIATAAMLVASFNAGWLFYDEIDRSAVIGISVGFPLGFFYYQNEFGTRANMPDLTTGSAAVMGTAAALAILALVAAWFFKYRKSAVTEKF